MQVVGAEAGEAAAAVAGDRSHRPRYCCGPPKPYTTYQFKVQSTVSFNVRAQAQLLISIV